MAPRTMCKKCYGTGEISIEETCPECKGSGRLSKEKYIKIHGKNGWDGIHRISGWMWIQEKERAEELYENFKNATDAPCQLCDIAGLSGYKKPGSIFRKVKCDNCLGAGWLDE